MKHHVSGLKKLLFTMAGSKYDKAAGKRGTAEKITEIVEQQQIRPAIDSRIFSLPETNEALQLVSKGPINGKVIIQM